MITIVVARYNEKVEWVNALKNDNVNVNIYNKGEKLEDDSLEHSYNEIQLNNVGREGHTYYKHICDNYDNLTDYTVFLQGNPFDHSPNLIDNLHKYIHHPELNLDFEYLSESIHYSSLDAECSMYWACANIHSTYERIFGMPCTMQDIMFGCGAQFIVSKTKILQRPKSFYENIVKILEYNISPIEGYDLERFHKYIFM